MFGPRLFKQSPFREQKGFSVIITGPVGAGKTTELFRQLERVEIAGGKTALFKPMRDDRDEGVKTHSGYERQAVPIKDPEDMFDHLKNDTTTVGIEEAQFFDDRVCGVVRVLVARGMQVIIAGLNLDFMGRPFGPMPVLMAQAEHIVKVYAVCMQCGADATRTHRKTDSKEQVVIGGMDMYEPVCTDCHERLLSGNSLNEL